MPSQRSTLQKREKGILKNTTRLENSWRNLGLSKRKMIQKMIKSFKIQMSRIIVFVLHIHSVDSIFSLIV
jgi:hypothetical protein